MLEHPEDLGRCSRGEPASIWQLPEFRAAFGDTPFVSVAGHQCQFGVDRKKPTQLLSDILEMEDFGSAGWPSFDSRGWYVGPLPMDCGHCHKDKMIRRTAQGGFHTSPTASYPVGMCEFLALRIMQDF